MKQDEFKKRSDNIELLEKYSNWLMKNGYLDTDWQSEPPYAIDEFLKTLPKNLLSKKPSVSDEEIEKILVSAISSYDLKKEIEQIKTLFSKSLPPQVVQSEVSCWLIENENQEWHCVREEISKTIGQFGKTVYYNEWTKNPLQAKRFSSKESAEATINVCNLKSCKATEHEFVNSLTPPDAENEAVMFAEWMLEQGCKKWSDDKWEIRKPLNITHTNGTSNYYTTQELFNLYKQGGK